MENLKGPRQLVGGKKGIRPRGAKGSKGNFYLERKKRDSESKELGAKGGDSRKQSVGRKPDQGCSGQKKGQC